VHRKSAGMHRAQAASLSSAHRAAAAAVLLLLSSCWTARAVAAESFQCHSDVDLGPVATAAKKGVALDDTTLWNCSHHIPALWPNTKERVQSLRLFKAWDPTWPEQARDGVWENIVRFAHANDAKVLVGAQITCREEDDDIAWNWTKQLLQRLGPKHVMGLAVGNEMELLFSKTAVDPTVTPNCITRMWQGGYFWRQFVRMVSDFDDLGFQDIKVTNVFGGLILAGVGEFPFFEDPRAMVNSFLVNATEKYGSRYVFTFNLYPYFDPANAPDPGTANHCELALAKCTCLRSEGCSVLASTALARKKIRLLTHGQNNALWLGETGWSSSLSASLATRMAACKAWSSVSALRKFYGEFLSWDLSEKTIDPPDHVFYFTARDSVNFGVVEHFGLLEVCGDARCKLRSHEYIAPTTTATSTRTSTATSTRTGTTTSMPDSDIGMSGHGHASASSMSSLPFDCSADFHNWRIGWSEGKKAWCCLQEGRGCPPTSTTSYRQKADRQDEDDEDTDEDTDEEEAKEEDDGSEDKIKHGGHRRHPSERAEASRHKRGRRRSTAAPAEHSTTSAPRKIRATTTARTSSSGTQHETSQAAQRTSNFNPYDCSDVEGMFDWSGAHRSWCCMIKGVGCPRTSPAPYDCETGLYEWETAWSDAKKIWCCPLTGAGCTGAPYPATAGTMGGGDGVGGAGAVVTSYRVTTTQRLSTSTSWPYDCSIGYFTWESGWSPGKRAWCCLHEGLRCPKLSGVSPPAVYASPASVLGGGYDCKAEYYHWEEGWSEEKKVWCCQNEGLGCPNQEPYDCRDEPADWEAVWTYAKKEWCCRNQGLGCQRETVVFGKKFDETALRRSFLSRVPTAWLYFVCGLMASVTTMWFVRSLSRSVSAVRSSAMRCLSREARDYSRLSLLEADEEVAS